MEQKVEDFMTGIADLAVVEEDATLFEAILTIGINRGGTGAGGMRWPAALVSDGSLKITGYLDFRNMFRKLEPKYGHVAESAVDLDFSPQWIEAELERQGLWTNPLDQICNKAAETVIRDLMTVPANHQITDADVTANEAIYQMVVTGNDYLFVQSSGAIIGIICISDIMEHLCELVKACRV